MASDKRARFVEEYLLDLNATQAAIRAGYSRKTAGQQGERLLKNVEIKLAVDNALMERSQRTKITADRVLTELARIAFANMGKFASLGPAGVEWQDTAEMPDDDTACIAEISETKTQHGGSIKLKLHDKLTALDRLGRHLSLFSDSDIEKFFASLPEPIAGAVRTLIARSLSQGSSKKTGRKK